MALSPHVVQLLAGKSLNPINNFLHLIIIFKALNKVGTMYFVSFDDTLFIFSPKVSSISTRF